MTTVYTAPGANSMASTGQERAIKNTNRARST